MQEAKFGVPKLHDSKINYIVPTLQVPWFQGPWTKGPMICESQNTGFQVKLEGFQRARLPRPTTSTKVPGLQRVEGSGIPELQGCRILRLQGSKVPRLQGSRNPRLQVSMVSKCFKALRFQSSGITSSRALQRSKVAMSRGKLPSLHHDPKDAGLQGFRLI